MISLVVLACMSLFAFFVITQTEKSITPISQKVGQRLHKLWLIAQAGMKENKYLRAEKALLTILKLDKHNAAAYNRLGILYTRQKEYKDAIECFEIASSIQPTASSFHNLGLIYYETENYLKALTAFEGALKLEDALAARHIAYAKVHEKLGNYQQVVDSLQTAIRLEPNQQSFKLLADVYEAMGETAAAKKLRDRMKKLIVPAGKPNRVKQPQRVIY